MIGRQLFLEKTELDEALDIVNEVIAHIEELNRNAEVEPVFYDDILLFASEILPHIDNKEEWINMGYEICKAIKQKMECDGYKYPISMIGGLGNRCFAVNSFCEQAGLLPSFSDSMKQLLFIMLNGKMKAIGKIPTSDKSYDVVNGVSGILYYLLDCNCTESEIDTLTKCIEFLLILAKDVEYRGRSIVRFHTLQPNFIDDYLESDYVDGSINFGLAHGMLGPLIALSKAYAKGFKVSGLKNAVEKIYNLYELYQTLDKAEVLYWPGRITVEEYWRKTCSPEHIHKPSSWCYGNIGIIRGLQKVSAYMNWYERERYYLEAMKHLLVQDVKTYGLASPSLCHGYSSVVAIQLCTYSNYKDYRLLVNLERNVKEIIKGYRNSNKIDKNLKDIRREGNWIEGYLKDLSLLTGSVGVATTLLSLLGSRSRVAKLLMID